MAEYVAKTTGRCDVLVLANLENPKAKAAFLRLRFGTVEGVRQGETFVGLETRKPAPGPGIL